MTGDFGDAAGAVIALMLGGVLFMLFADALGPTAPIDFRLWGVVYLMAAILLAVGATYAGVRAVLG